MNAVYKDGRLLESCTEESRCTGPEQGCRAFSTRSLAGDRRKLANLLRDIYGRIESTVLSSRCDESLLRPRMPELDSIRGLAILMVLVFHGFMRYEHADAIPRAMAVFIDVTRVGRLGVNLFFVLSGFLITGLLVDSVRRADYFRRFYVRRVSRILPAFYATLVLLVVTRHAPRAFLGFSAVFLANLSPLFGVTMAYAVLWTLAVEEHFYLVWPMIVRHMTMRNLLRLCAAIVLFDPMLRAISYVFASRHGTEWNDVARYTWNAADGMVLGCILALSVREFHWTRKRALRIAAGVMAGAAAIFCAGLPFGIATRHGTLLGAAMQEVPWNFIFGGMLTLFLVLGTGQWKGLVVMPVLMFLGRISYGLYLIHFLILDEYDAVAMRYFPRLVAAHGDVGLIWIRFVIASTCSILIAWLSRETIEEFFLNLAKRDSPARPLVPSSRHVHQGV
jgi:peptidoglycan/LPS O-acetylase OafA/YrhL